MFHNRTLQTVRPRERYRTVVNAVTAPQAHEGSAKFPTPWEQKSPEEILASFGVTYLSKEALRDARRFMHADEAGVRDEIGFLTIHQRYADRFFPGTSVLHTRLRYVLFIPWIYADVRNSRHRRRDPAEAIASGEHKLTERLLGQDGVIGGRVHPKTPDQPPSYVYWTALQTWGLLRQRGICGNWSRKRVEDLLAAPAPPAGKLSDDDGLPIGQTDWPFAGCPEPSKDWSSGENLSFKLKKRERTYLARQLQHVHSPVSSGERSLLALLVGKPLEAADYAWSPEIVDMACHEQAALVRAGQAAALAAIGQGHLRGPS